MTLATSSAADATASSAPKAPDVARLPVVDFRTTEFREGSVKLLAAITAETPFCRVLPAEALGVTRFADVDAILRSPGVFSSDTRHRSVQVEGVEPIGALLMDDPPTHTRLRALFGQAFTPARVALMEPRVLAVARSLVQRVQEAGESFDLVKDVAIPLPVYVICELLGIDKNDMPSFKRWSDDVTGGSLVMAMPEGPAKDARLAEVKQSLRELDAYLARAIAESKKHAGENLLTYMTQAAEGGDRLSEKEVLSLAKLLLVAGNETTTKVIGLTMNQLLENPAALEAVQSSPGLIAGAIEEAVRIEGPIPAVSRIAKTATTIAGASIAAGTVLAPLVSAANLDASVFPDPTRYDVRRKITRHLGFGGGIHQCLGAPLARMEARLAFEEVFATLGNVERAAPAKRQTVSSFRGFESMPLRFRPAARRAAPAAAAAASPAVAERVAEKSDSELGLDKRAREVVRVARVREIANGVKLFRLVHPAGGLLTRFTPGSHIVVHMRDGGAVYRNAYSLLNAQYGNGFSYFIAVAKDPNGRGGSRYLHEKVTEGMELSVSVPANHFPPAPSATKHLLVAGGIGITPLAAIRDDLRSRGERVELHYTFRSVACAAFAEDFELGGDPNVRLYDNSAGRLLDVDALLRSQPEGTHVYVCGPEGLMNAVIQAAARAGWPVDSVHFERFGAPRPAGAASFEVECLRSHKSISVGGGETLLEALEHAGLTVPFACRAGSCGACELGVVEGQVEHHDSVLTAAERADGKKILPCVSRGKTRLVLDV
jgi:cytochrome P450/ferredoxin-NADP reductase